MSHVDESLHGHFMAEMTGFLVSEFVRFCTMAPSWLVQASLLASICAQVLANSEIYPLSFRSRCLEFEPAKYIQNATLDILEYVPAGTNLQFPYNDPSCGRPNQTVSVDVCRIALNISTSSTSSVISEIWLPGTWSQRFLSTGNGGIDGCTKYEDLNYGTKYGFATVGSNNGHNGTGGVAFYHNDEVLKDYVWRSLHTITEVGKSLTYAFYSTPHKTSYYIGCSGGGRQGVHAAELFPKDFDGIVVGDPAVNFNSLYSWRASFYDITSQANSTNFITASLWKGLIHNEVLRQCDELDGVKDGVIENPDICHFDPKTLLCSSNSNSTQGCLSDSQVDIVQKVFSPMQGPNGTIAYPAMQPGSEISAAAGLYSGKPFAYSLDWFRYVVLNDPNWSGSPFSLSDISTAQALNPFNVSTYPSTLLPFSNSGKTPPLPRPTRQSNNFLRI
ncbi:hypothetical protein G7Y89_g1456 [Cudoniella acicularis]|uniref:Carboxylic ester hydrolase n=1 Tax=Cudoniella acicularis TaxID=354080 RepID=A0A8H4W9I9_9HELO|nr:hypothetical protein G7Y89_g1456 [Cudoniella acicularis]